MLFKSLLATAAALCGTASASLPAIEIVGNKFYYSNNGSQFYMKGVAYQQDTANSSSTFVDPLISVSNCKRDIPYLQELDTNVIRVYALDVDSDHTECMELLQEAGIYLIADLSVPDYSIDRSDPAWTTTLLNRYTSVVDAFHNYTNVLGFFAGNEVTNKASNTDASAFVKAAVRDTKAYIKEKGYRSIPVGYSANDDTEIRVELAEYFACGDEEDRADFFGINMYEWCGNSTFKESGYLKITSQYKNLGIPVFFSEYGCNEVTPRLFEEVGTLYSSDMTDVWSGGIVYMYFEEENNYGLVTISNSKVSTLTDFNNYKTEILAIDPTYATVSSDATTSSASVTTCPTIDSVWQATSVLPPTPDSTACACMEKSLTCVVSEDVDSDDYSDLFSYVCQYVDCDGITANGTTGDYGAYSPCTPKQKLNFALNLYYEDHGSSSSACDFSGSATTQSATTASSCSAYLSSAGVSGLGTISGDIANADASTTTTGSGSSTSTSTSSSSSTSSSGAALGASASNSGLLMITSFLAICVGLVLA